MIYIIKTLKTFGTLVLFILFFWHNTSFMEKHLPYFQLLDALRVRGTCALCFLEETTLEGFLQSFLEEEITDPTARRRWRAAGGFCARHTRKLIRRSDPLALSILYADLLSLLREELEKRSSQKKTESRPNHETCPACCIEQEALRRYCKALAAFVEETEIQQALIENFSFCFLHFREWFFELKKENSAAQWRRRMDEKIENLENRLKNFQEKTKEAATRGSLDDRDATAWKEALRLLFGSREIF